jgi:glycosyltransferase involved in cell wall biosynthesis
VVSGEHEPDRPARATPEPDVSIVIPARNAARTLGEQLAALAGQDLEVPYEVIVVDNASTDATAEVATEWMTRLPIVRVVRCDRPGANAARNVGIRESRAPRVLTCDSDDVVTPSWARRLSGALSTAAVVGGPTHLDALNDPETIRARRNPVGDEQLPTAFHRLPYAVGANLGFRREVFDAVDGFDEAFHFGGDEIDFCWRAQYTGYDLAFVPDAVVQYRLRSSTREAMRQVHRYARADTQLYAKHLGLGMLPALTGRLQAWRAMRRFLPLLRVDRLVRGQTRQFYLRTVARYSGAVAGWRRYGLFV